MQPEARMPSLWESLRNRLLALRGTHGAVAEFCRKSGYPRQTVEAWLSGQSVPSADKLDPIAEALGISLAGNLPATAAQPTPLEALEIVRQALTEGRDLSTVRGRVVDLIASATDDELQGIERTLASYLGKNTSARVRKSGV